MDVDEVLRMELHSMILKASAEELHSALNSPMSPIRDQFLRFLASSYADWISSQTTVDSDVVIDEWRAALQIARKAPSSKHAASLSDDIASPYVDDMLVYESDAPEYMSDTSDASLTGSVGLREKDPFRDFLPLTDRSPRYDEELTAHRQKTILMMSGEETPPSPRLSKRMYETLHGEQKALLKSKLPALSEISSVEKRNAAFVSKLKLCAVRFDSQSKNIWHQKGIEKKRLLLTEILDYIAKYAWYSERVVEQCIRTISRNLFRALPKTRGRGGEDGGDSGEELFEDPDWGHLQLIYDLTLRLVICTDVDKKTMKRYLEGRFMSGLIELFSSEDPREREYLKTIMHRIYGRFMPLRSVIRNAIADSCYRTIYDKRTVNGVAEYLEIFCSIIHGFSVPVKDEHKRFLRNVLIPLHKCPKMERFHEQLVACSVQFVFKERDVAPLILGGLLRFWPSQSPAKEEMFIAEVVNVLRAWTTHKDGFDYAGDESVRSMIYAIIAKLVECMLSEHHTVAERALVVWIEESIESLIDLDKSTLWPKIIGALSMNKSHWNASLREYNEGAMDGFRLRDASTFDRVQMKMERVTDRAALYEYVCSPDLHSASKMLSHLTSGKSKPSLGMGRRHTLVSIDSDDVLLAADTRVRHRRMRYETLEKRTKRAAR